MPRLRRSDPSVPGIVRRRRGRGFEYLDATSRARISDPETLQRIKDLVIPPAWSNVWICPDPLGHLQAVGTDAAGRRQYRYHPNWRLRKDREKFERMLALGRILPEVRSVCSADLAGTELTRRRVLACAVRLLDRGFFRIGSEAYAEQNETYGLATIRKNHVRVDGDVITFDFTAKGGKRRLSSVVDPEVAQAVAELKRRRSGGPELLAYRVGRRWRDVRSADINAYIKEVTGGDFTAKDFRTWNATVLAAVALAVSAPSARSRTARKRAISRAVTEVAGYLGNTPAVCRSSYIDPRVFDRFNSGWTIRLDHLADVSAYGELSTQGAIEAAVIDLLTQGPRGDAVERVA